MQTVVEVLTGGIASVVVGSLSAYVTHKGLLGQFARFVTNHGKQIEQRAVNVVQSLVETPAAKAVEAHVKAELDKAIGDLKQTTLGQYAAQAIAASGKKLSDLTPEQVNALALHISTLLPSEWHITKGEITAALELAQKGADAIAATPVVKAAAQFAAEVAAVQQAPAQPQATA
ncbi:MAG: hypothetical protein K6T26_08860 [Alicyclobacillus sp.]|nr:hypothetical protein [Alicyclobacillus sp.]